MRLPSGDHVGFPSSEPSALSAATLTGSVPSECMTHTSRPKKPLGDRSMRLNAMCAPSGDNDPPEPSCTNRRGEPPNTEILHKLAFKGCSSRETSKRVPSVNQSSTRAEKSGGKGTEWVSPVRI